MRYQPAHAATGDQGPTSPGKPTPTRTALAIAVAAVIGLVPAVFVATPAYAAPGDVSFDSDLEGPEADSFTFELRRVGGSADPLTLAYSTGGGTATPNVDYEPISGTTSFPANSSNSVVKRFTINGLPDALDEDDETFTLTFTGTAGGQPLTVVANGILDDDDATPTYSLSVSNPVAEAATNAVVTATLSAVSGRAVTIPVSTADGTALDGQDYTAVSNANISIAAGNTTGTVNVPIIDDTLDEDDQQSFTVSGANGAGTNVAGGGSVTAQIADNEATPTVSVAGPGAAVENSTLNFPLTLSGASERTVTVVTTTANGTATAGADYTTASGTTTFMPGSTSETVAVTTAQDTLDEVNPETFTLTMSAPVNAVLDATVSATGSINDDDVAPTVTLTPGNVTEGDSGTQTRTFTATLDAPSGRPVAIDYDVSGGTATPGTDYTAGTGTLTFAPGDTVKTFDVTILGDQIDEDPDENVNITLSNTAGTVASGGSLTTNTITITDDDSTPTFSVADVTVAEGGTTATRTFVVTLSNPSAQAVTFDVSASDDSAEGGGTDPGDNDYDPPSASVTVQPGDTTATISLNVIGDTVFEDDETATVSVERAAGENDATGGADTSTLTLTNDDTAPLVQLSSVSGAEGSSIGLMGTVTGVAEADIPVTITLAGSSVNGSNPADGPDFTYGGPIAATIPAGDNTGAPVALTTIALDADTIDETDETLLATLTDPAGDVATATALQTITDDPNDLPPAVSVGDATVNENAGSVNVDVTLAFDNGQNADSTERPVVVNYQTANGTATAGADYTAVANGQLTIAAGDTTGTVSVPVTDDSAYEIAETFTVTATSVNPAEAVIDDASGTVTIAGNDLGSRPSFSIDNVTRAENAAGTADFTVTLSGASTQDVTFDVATSDGTAEDAGAGPGSNDFDAPPTTLTIPAGSTTGVISVPVNADSVFEANETATVDVELAGGESDAVGMAVAGTLTLSNDDAAPSIALNTQSGAEGSNITVQATITGVAQDDLTFNLSMTGDNTGSNNPAEGGDFTDSGAQATIAAGTASGSTVTLRTFAVGNDTIDEANESVRVLVTDVAGDVAAVSSVYTLTDDPNDLPPSVSLANANVNENAGPASVPVTLSFGGGNGASSTERPVVVNYQTANGTATAGSDYTAAASGASVTIAAGDTSGTIPVTITDDAAYERAETFTVTATSVTPGEAVIGTATSTVTIGLSDSSARPSFSVANVSRAENAGGPAEIVVTLTSPTTQDVDFTVGVADGTAVEAGSGPGSNDFDAPVSTLTIPAGSSTGTVAVTVNGDTVFEGNETATVNVALANGEDDATGSAAAATLTLTNDDAAPSLALNSESSTEGTDIVVIGTVTGVAQAATTLNLQLSGDATSGNNAAETADFVDSGAQATIPAGTASGTQLTLRTFRLNNDTVDEPTESVRVRATDAAGNVAMTSSLYRITDDPNDLPPAISVGDVTVAEGVGDAEVPLALTFGGSNDATSTERSLVVDYLTTAGTATATADFTATSGGQVTITAGSSSGTIEVPIADDARDEFAESFTVRATTVTPAESAISDDTGTVTITDNDPDVPKPTFSVADVARAENASGAATFTVELSAAAEDPVSFTVGIADDTAVDGGSGAGSNDYNAPSGTLTIPAGETTGTVAVTVNTDSVYEPDETAILTVALAAGELDATGSAREATLTIENDDTKPALTLNTASGFESDDVDVSAVVTGTAQEDVAYELTFEGDNTGNNDGAEETDFDASGVVAVIPARTATGTRVNFGSIRLASDTIDEATETIRLIANDPDIGRTEDDETSTYRIFDDPDDLPPSIEISDESIGEGEGSVDLTVSMTFSGDTTATEQPIRVPWTTANSSARSGLDFTADGGTLTIEAGAESGTINVQIVDGELHEPDQFFTVELGSATPSGVTVAKSVGGVSILDDDEAVAPTLTAPESRVGIGVVGLTGQTSEGATVRLYGAPVAGGSDRVLLATTTASITGGYFFSRSLPVGYTFHTRADNQNSPVRTVRLVQSPTLAGSSPSRGVVSLTATGNPRTAGQTVSIQRQNPSGTWSTVASGRLTSAGTYAVTLRGQSSGVFVNYRAVIAATPGQGILGGISATRRVGVR